MMRKKETINLTSKDQNESLWPTKLVSLQYKKKKVISLCWVVTYTMCGFSDKTYFKRTIIEIVTTGT